MSGEFKVYRVLISILTIFLANFALALDTEYKNTLSKVELNKYSDSSYSINLYTEKQFSEPVKVIKKSDLNYYILLPETKNSVRNIISNNSDIRSIDTQLFPYAGSDVKNGYTKININTAKPINFTINTKLANVPNSQTAVKKDEIKKEEVKTAIGEVKVQKKNLVQEPQKPKRDSIVQKSPKLIQKTTIATSKPVNKSPKAAAKLNTDANIDIEKSKKQITDKEEKQNKLSQQKTIEESKEIKNIQQNTQEEQILSEDSEENKELKAQETNQYDLSDKVKKENIKDKIEKKKFIDSAKVLLLKNRIKNKLLEYGLSLKELAFMLAAGLASFAIMLLILTKSQETQTRLKSKSDFADKTSGLIAKKGSETQKQNNQYFIFDKNIKQTGLTPPISSNSKNYELSSYNPNIEQNENPIVEPYMAKKVTSEYDIIQKILKDDNTQNNTTVNVLEYTEAKKQDTEIVATPVQKQETQNEEQPEILSNVEIAPQRGFMCVSYNDSINLVGYIFDDVFAIYNFHQQKLEDYTIRFRLSEKTEKGANFIVRIGKTKLLVAVSKSSMHLEVAM